ncbi:oligopeptide transport system ATP-binding protein [Paenibacillus algorifonticola]|uniref:Oligopeptide transport system ATP-binding protein n=1 Tax=Paenibacillus algorifonticola TaxID=684063 RepID=A0A1I2BXX9_9BACL|nr:ABC transporter ATP-binding protein [Paenibacillus algorifonticola]SFE60981.1 oligopeptide transport system ATP-binding protein [Paenibacillus algorifonticola]
MPEALLQVKELQTSFVTREGTIPAVNRVSFSVAKGETLCIVGESGSGKSVTSLSIIGLVDQPGKVVGGKIELEGRNLLAMNKRELRKIRGNEISMIFQEPMTSLNPVFTVGSQLSEAMQVHMGVNRKEACRRSVELLKLVGIPHPDKALRYFPHQLSGGMRQRVMIAMALACHPKLLIADEPTTALDVTIQAQILELIRQLSAKLGMGVILITHDLGIVAEMADRVAVMYAGEIVEEALVDDLFDRPLHPYTIGLLRSLPQIKEHQEELYSISGTVPHLLKLPTGCAFQARCPGVTEECRQRKPELELREPGHSVRCFHPGPADKGEVV